MSSISGETKYVVFKIDNEYYGIDINNVKSIERIQDFTRVPNAPPYVKGVINLRGEVVPVIDLRMRFELTPRELDSNSRIIIVFVNEIQIGLLVDSSSEVIEINGEDVDSPPIVKENISEDFINGIGKQNGNLIILIDIEKVIGHKEIEQVS
ncbi:purine-binding chemotaxis protein CheW [Proteiniborus ethanoligenes]|uniref:Chemotaxis protein CheW n=1 Tax=Proteiniborus ethanoligenes TaxID=415015 RepID=A0A1H3N4Y8_9FIRM|nr:chemotaxis protein CheW [Proteiniborus ethanoligenes]SDY83906.1 purine-binding chemotaxis protein CheW [Proteiniborus ethanoligenes]